MSGRRKKPRPSVTPPPQSPSPRRATGGGGGGGDGGGGSFSKIPAAVGGLIGSFADRPARIAASRVSAKLGATLEAGCNVGSCLASKVRDTCLGVCEQRGARLIRQAVEADPNVLREFTFASDGEGSVRRVQFTSAPRWPGEEKQDGENSTLRRMQLKFVWDSDDVERVSDAELRAAARGDDALYLADGKEARDVRELVRLARDRYERPGVVADLEDVYEAYRKPTTVGEITQRLKQLRRETNVDETEREEEDAARGEAMFDAYRTVAGRRPAGDLPPLKPIPFDVTWIAYTIASLFRDGSAAGWRVASANLDADSVRDDFVLQVTAPLADISTLFARLLSEPPVAFNRLVLTPEHARAPTRTKQAEKMLRDGVRVWRGADLVSGKFVIEDAEFHRLYPEVRRLAAAAARAVENESEEDEEEEEEKEEPREGKEEKRGGGGGGPSSPKAPPTGARGRPETREERRAREAIELESERDIRRHYASLIPR